jgi:hypothetical protein
MKLLYDHLYSHHGGLYFLKWCPAVMRIHLQHDLHTLSKNIRLRPRQLFADLSELCDIPEIHRYRTITLQSWLISDKIGKKLTALGFERQDAPKIGYIELALLLKLTPFFYPETHLHYELRMAGFQKTFEKYYYAARWRWSYLPKKI